MIRVFFFFPRFLRKNLCCTRNLLGGITVMLLNLKRRKPLTRMCRYDLFAHRMTKCRLKFHDEIPSNCRETAKTKSYGLLWLTRSSCDCWFWYIDLCFPPSAINWTHIHKHTISACRRGNSDGHINKVKLRRARLVLGLETSDHLWWGSTIPVFSCALSQAILQAVSAMNTGDVLATAGEEMESSV